MIAWLDRLLARARAVFTKRALDADFDAELAHHLELLTEDHIKSGMAPEAARRQAYIDLGGVEQIRELHRDVRGLPWLENFLADLRYTVRVMRRDRSFTCIALVILACGIGLNTTVFSLVNTVLLRPIPFAHADRLVWIFNGDPAGSSHDLSAIASQVDTWEGLQSTNRTLEQIEGYNPFSVRQTYRLTGIGEPQTIVSVDVSPGLFGMLGISPYAGRLFLPEDGIKNAPHRVLLSHQLWLRCFAADPQIVGKTVQINGAAVEVVGILPELDAFTSVFFPATRVDVFSPLCNDEARYWGNAVSLIGRAKPEQSTESIRADLRLAAASVKKQHPERDQYFSANVIPLHDWVSGSLRRPLLFLWIAAGLVLAIVSFNLGGLLLARGVARRKELALRCALGAGQARIAAQLFTECLVLVALGAVLGGVLAIVFINYLSIRSSVEIPLLQSLKLDGHALGFTVLLACLTGIACGALPAWQLARVRDIQGTLKDEGRGSSGGRYRSRTRHVLVIAEVALACLLATSACLMVRSFVNLLHVDLGFQPANLIAVRVDPMTSRSQSAFLETLLDRVRALPGVEQAAITDCIPVERDRSWGVYTVNQDNPKEQRWFGAHVRLVSPGLLSAMGTTLVAGRDFTSQDAKNAPGVIILNQSLAHSFWPGENAIGRQVKVGGGGFTCTVVGVVADVMHDGPEAPAGNEMYLSFNQVEDANSWDLMVRTRLPVAALASSLRAALQELDATMPLTQMRPMQSLVDRTLSSRRLLVWLIGGFAAFAIGLAALGLYGVISYLVTQQTREIGIRMALGADAATVRRQIVRQTMRLALWGLAAGLAASFIASNLMQSLLYGVSTSDAPSYFMATIALLACTFIAGYLPARRASQTDPLIALRAE